MKPTHRRRVKCDPACLYDETETDKSSVRSLLLYGSRIDRLYAEKYVPLRERRLLSKLVRTRAIYDDVRLRLLSSNANFQNEPDNKTSSSILELVNMVDRGEMRTKKSCSCCSCISDIGHDQICKGQRFKRYFSSKSSALAKKVSKRKTRSRQATKHIRSDPCTCTCKLSKEENVKEPYVDGPMRGLEEKEFKSRNRQPSKITRLLKKDAYDRRIDEKENNKELLEVEAPITTRRSKKQQAKKLVKKSYYAIKSSCECIVDNAKKYKEKIEEIKVSRKGDRKLSHNFPSYDSLDKYRNEFKNKRAAMDSPFECNEDICVPEECMEKIKSILERRARKKRMLEYETMSNTYEGRKKHRKVRVQTPEDTKIKQYDSISIPFENQNSPPKQTDSPLMDLKTTQTRKRDNAIKRCFCILKLKSKKAAARRKPSRSTSNIADQDVKNSASQMSYSSKPSRTIKSKQVSCQCVDDMFIEKRNKKFGKVDSRDIDINKPKKRGRSFSFPKHRKDSKRLILKKRTKEPQTVLPKQRANEPEIVTPNKKQNVIRITSSISFSVELCKTSNVDDFTKSEDANYETPLNQKPKHKSMALYEDKSIQSNLRQVKSNRNKKQFYSSHGTMTSNICPPECPNMNRSTYSSSSTLIYCSPSFHNGSEKRETFIKSHGSRGDIGIDKSSATSFSTREKNKRPVVKRCFCTLQLHKIGRKRNIKDVNLDSTKNKSQSSKLIGPNRSVSHKSTLIKQKPLKLKCHPYICVDMLSPHQDYNTKSVCSNTCSSSCRSVSSSIAKHNRTKSIYVKSKKKKSVATNRKDTKDIKTIPVTPSHKICSLSSCISFSVSLQKSTSDANKHRSDKLAKKENFRETGFNASTSFNISSNRKKGKSTFSRKPKNKQNEKKNAYKTDVYTVSRVSLSKTNNLTNSWFTSGQNSKYAATKVIQIADLNDYYVNGPCLRKTKNLSSDDSSFQIPLRRCSRFINQQSKNIFFKSHSIRNISNLYTNSRLCTSYYYNTKSNNRLDGSMLLNNVKVIPGQNKITTSHCSIGRNKNLYTLHNKKEPKGADSFIKRMFSNEKRKMIVKVESDDNESRQNTLIKDQSHFEKCFSKIKSLASIKSDLFSKTKCHIFSQYICENTQDSISLHPKNEEGLSMDSSYSSQDVMLNLLKKKDPLKNESKNKYIQDYSHVAKKTLLNTSNITVAPESSYYKQFFYTYRSRLEPYECEPGFCIPYQCDPYECEKRIRMRNMHFKHTNTNNRNRSVSSYMPDFGRPAHRHSQTYTRHKDHPVGVYIHKDKSDKRPVPVKGKGVKICSTLSFEVSISRNSGGGSYETPEVIPVSRPVMVDRPTHYDNRRKMKYAGTHGQRGFGTPSQTDFVGRRSTGIDPLLTRCFCTLKLHKAGRHPPTHSMGSYAAMKPLVFHREAATGTGRHRLKPYECEPGVCIPGQCDPYECYERIKRRTREASVDIQDWPRRGVGSMTYNPKYRNNWSNLQRRRRMTDSSNLTNIPERSPPPRVTYNDVQAPNRGLRLSSNISVSFEIARGSLPNGNITTGNGDTYYRKHDDTGNRNIRKYNAGNNYNNQTESGNYMRKKKCSSKCIGADHSTADGMAQVQTLLRRCFCTRNLHRKNMGRNNETYNRQAVPTHRDQETGTKLKRYSNYRCEPEFSSPFQYNPNKCDEKIEDKHTLRSQSIGAGDIVVSKGTTLPKHLKTNADQSYGRQKNTRDTIYYYNNVEEEHLQHRTPLPITNQGIKCSISNDYSVAKGGKNVKPDFEQKPHKRIRYRKSRNTSLISCNAKACPEICDTIIQSHNPQIVAKKSSVNNVLKKCFCSLKLQNNKIVSPKSLYVERVAVVEDIKNIQKLKRKEKHFNHRSRKENNRPNKPILVSPLEYYLNLQKKSDMTLQLKKINSCEFKTLFPYKSTNFNKTLSTMKLQRPRPCNKKCKHRFFEKFHFIRPKNLSAKKSQLSLSLKEEKRLSKPSLRKIFNYCKTLFTYNFKGKNSSVNHEPNKTTKKQERLKNEDRKYKNELANLKNNRITTVTPTKKNENINELIFQPTEFGQTQFVYYATNKLQRGLHNTYSIKRIKEGKKNKKTSRGYRSNDGTCPCCFCDENENINKFGAVSNNRDRAHSNKIFLNTERYTPNIKVSQENVNLRKSKDGKKAFQKTQKSKSVGKAKVELKHKKEKKKEEDDEELAPKLIDKSTIVKGKEKTKPKLKRNKIDNSTKVKTIQRNEEDTGERDSKSVGKVKAKAKRKERKKKKVTEEVTEKENKKKEVIKKKPVTTTKEKVVTKITEPKRKKPESKKKPKEKKKKKSKSSSNPKITAAIREGKKLCLKIACRGEKKKHTDKCQCCICTKKRKKIKKKVVDEEDAPVNIPFIEMEVESGSMNILNRDLVVEQIRNAKNINQFVKKKFDKCLCGSKICGKDEKTKQMRLISTEPCICGNETCEESVRNIYMEHVCECREVIEKRKRDAIRKKKYAKLDKIRLKKRRKEEARLDKLIKKSTSNSVIISESLLDVCKLLLSLTYGTAKNVAKAVAHPRDTYKSIQSATKDPARVIDDATETFKDSGFLVVLKRIRKRLSRLPYLKKVGEYMEQHQFTHFLWHITDPKARVKKIKPIYTRKRPDYAYFNCNLYVSSLRKRPCFWVYKKWPSFYPHCLSMLSIWRQLTEVLLFLLAILVWSPCIAAMELCRAIMCCTFCTG